MKRDIKIIKFPCIECKGCHFIDLTCKQTLVYAPDVSESHLFKLCPLRRKRTYSNTAKTLFVIAQTKQWPYTIEFVYLLRYIIFAGVFVVCQVFPRTRIQQLSSGGKSICGEKLLIVKTFDINWRSVHCTFAPVNCTAILFFE